MGAHSVHCALCLEQGGGGGEGARASAPACVVRDTISGHRTRAGTTKAKFKVKGRVVESPRFTTADSRRTRRNDRHFYRFLYKHNPKFIES